MIKSFRCSHTENLFNRNFAKRFVNIERIAQRKLAQIDAAVKLSELTVPPGNKLEALKGNRLGQHSIRINDQWRICFEWTNNGVYEVEIVNYH